MTTDAETVQVSPNQQEVNRGASGKSLTELANSLPTINTTGLRADHAAAAQAIVARAKAALLAAAESHGKTKIAATAVGTIDKTVKAQADTVETPRSRLV